MGQLMQERLGAAGAGEGQAGVDGRSTPAGLRHRAATFLPGVTPGQPPHHAVHDRHVPTSREAPLPDPEPLPAAGRQTGGTHEDADVRFLPDLLVKVALLSHRRAGNFARRPR